MSVEESELLALSGVLDQTFTGSGCVCVGVLSIETVLSFLQWRPRRGLCQVFDDDTGVALQCF